MGVVLDPACHADQRAAGEPRTNEREEDLAFDRFEVTRRLVSPEHLRGQLEVRRGAMLDRVGEGDAEVLDERTTKHVAEVDDPHDHIAVHEDVLVVEVAVETPAGTRGESRPHDGDMHLQDRLDRSSTRGIPHQFDRPSMVVRGRHVPAMASIREGMVETPQGRMDLGDHAADAASQRRGGRSIPPARAGQETLHPNRRRDAIQRRRHHRPAVLGHDRRRYRQPRRVEDVDHRLLELGPGIPVGRDLDDRLLAAVEAGQEVEVLPGQADELDR